MDADSGSYLFERDADERASPASLAKVMTAEIVFGLLKAGKVSLDDKYVVSENAWRKGGGNSRGSTMFAQVNSKIRVEDLIRGLVIMSGNDAAITLAENIAGAEEAFAGMMNKRASELGLIHSTFANAWGGSDPNQKTTMRDMALLGAQIVKAYPEYYHYFGERQFLWNKISQPNRNPLLLMNIGADGLKTGNVDESGYAILGSAVEDDRRLFVALNGCKNASERADDARKLLLWGFRAFERKNLFAAGEVIGGARVYGGALSEAPVASDRPVAVFMPRGSTERLTGRIVYEGPLVPPVRKGDKVARLIVMRGQTVAVDMPLAAAEDVGQGPLYWRAFDAVLELGGSLFRKAVNK